MVPPLAAAAACLAALPSLAPGVASADTSPGPSNLPNCLPENFPHAGNPRTAQFEPYDIPFTATLGDPVHHKLGGGYLEIKGAVFTTVLGGPISPLDGTGTITAAACGVLALPNESGAISGNPAYGSSNNSNQDQYNNNFVFNNPIGVSIGLTGTGIPLLNAYGSALGQLAASIDKAPAANGGMNVEFEASAKATAVFNVGAITNLVNLLGASAPPALVTLLKSLGGLAPGAPISGGTCTVPIGNLTAAGVPSADFGSVTKLTGSQNTTPVHLTSGAVTAEPVNPLITSGQPVTGPITDAQAVLVANDFPVAAIDPNTPPSPDTVDNAYNPKGTPDQLCTPSLAGLFNSLLGLPSAAGNNLFYAPGTFSVFTSK
jgi:hypothetical protein